MNNDIRKQFDILNKITYFDSAALVLKPKIAIDAIHNYYENISISSRTQDTPLGNLVNQTIFNVRQKVANLIDAKINEIIFTSGTTESINLFVNMFSHLLKPKDVILLHSYNHSSNLVPWIEIAKKTKAIIKISDDVELDLIKTKNIKILALSQETNNFNKSFDFSLISKICKEKKIWLFNDAAQAISHSKVSLNLFDIVVFSTNKFYGPTGMGILAIKEDLLKKLRPVKFGGGTVNEINKDHSFVLKTDISVFEPGTPDIAGFFMFDKGLDFFNSIGYQRTQNILKNLSIYLHKKLMKLKNINVYSKPGHYIALINVKNINPQDVATYLGQKNIYTIAGIFCAQYLKNVVSEHSFLRISLGIYNNYDDIDKLVDELEKGGDFYAF
ncbi:aminotransferase class V-fold PLP-dependent enzyme [Mycoplasmopsis felis]|uniref:aminotransferase class V-fold PLP-dependent enzyme n=1 Tax=Mycoplasmopsis felis TaxID=33923 RepID=UPI002AFFE13E|nr:aminotransferase class V-fold PLP-dependent enzyme [Mycoplasmopsis felis]WQQ09783.1 aminotransferase class V-fold PLP-dependent enzyme [Mycoplasmopsis felis]